ncbi:MAG TPA: CPXCG motif-containing cysteine-rich protein [Lysobacter sp.]|nr:CPXCG motif-containing cysteine-rich protein [Lysobacter sp.]
MDDDLSLLPSHEIVCPHCGERITVFVDETAGVQRYVEDCTVCCRPIEIEVRPDPDGDVSVDARREGD